MSRLIKFFPVCALIVPVVSIFLLPFGALANLPTALLMVAASALGCVQLVSGGLSVCRKLLQLSLASLIFIVVYTLSAFNNDDLGLDALKTVVQIPLVLGFFFYARHNLIINDATLRRVIYILSLCVVIPAMVVLFFLAKAQSSDIDSLWVQLKNNLGALALCLVVLNLCFLSNGNSEKWDKFWSSIALIASFSVLAVSGSRGAQLGLISFLVVYCTWSLVRLKAIYFWMTLIFLPCFIYIYINLEQLGGFLQVQSYVLKWTGGNVYSGRQLIWPVIIDAVYFGAPLLGFGPSAQASTFLRRQGTFENWSAHDLYLQVYLQAGLFGICALAIFLLALWRVLFQRHVSPSGRRIACAFFVAMCVNELFEVSVLQNNLTAGLCMWLVLAIASSKTDSSFLDESGKGVSPRVI